MRVSENPRGATLPGEQEPEVLTRAFVVVEHVTYAAREAAEGSGGQDIAGAVVLQFESARPDMWLLVDRLLVRSTSVPGVVAEVFVGAASRDFALKNINLRDYTPQGIGDVADYDPPLSIGPGQALFVRWSGINIGSGAICTAVLSQRLAVEVVRMVERVTLETLPLEKLL